MDVPSALPAWESATASFLERRISDSETVSKGNTADPDSEPAAVPSSDATSTCESADLEKKAFESVSPSNPSGSRKSGGSIDSGHSLRCSVPKFVPQFKKTTQQRRNGVSPINWFPRKKTDSFLMRKIKHLQEVEGMSSSLDETLGNANPHYTRMTREKIAAGEAARKAMEARKAAMVEGSWCRILQAARIQSKEAEAELEKSKKHEADAFQAARAMGVTMYDRPDCPRRSWEVESSPAGGGGPTHTVAASFETAFEVDKEVAAAVKEAFVRLTNCPSYSNKEEFRDLLRKISENPDNEINLESKEESESDPETQELVSRMLERLKGLQEDELASLAIIVATCGLSAALIEGESGKVHSGEPVTSCWPDTSTRKDAEAELPSLDKLLVKHVSRLEREVQEARDLNKKISALGHPEHCGVSRGQAMSESTPDLGSIIFVKHVSKLEREILKAKNSQKEEGLDLNESGYDRENKDINRLVSGMEQIERRKNPLPVKRMSRAERAKLEALKAFSSLDEGNEPFGLDKVLVKSVHWLEREKKQALLQGNDYTRKRNTRKQEEEAADGLDKILVKHVSKLERERLALGTRKDDVVRVKRRDNHQGEGMESLGDMLVKPKLEKAKVAQPLEDRVKHVGGSFREARERELQESWGGLSLGNSIRPHHSRLELDKAAWRKAEEEEQVLAGLL